nr:DegV family protein [Pediococcus damnosus]
MTKIAIVTDSTAYLAQNICDRLHITVAPISVAFGDQQYRERIDISDAEFYKRLKTEKTFPTTAPPSMGVMEELYHNLAEAGYEEVVSIHLSSGISGFTNNLRAFAASVTEIKVHVVDAQIAVQPLGYLVIQAAKMAAEGKSTQDIMAKVTELRATIGEYFIVDDLKNLAHSGRLGNSSAFVGSLLKVKPILALNKEKFNIEAVDKVRSMKRARANIVSRFILGPTLSVVLLMKQKIYLIRFGCFYVGQITNQKLRSGNKAFNLNWQMSPLLKRDRSVQWLVPIWDPACLQFYGLKKYSKCKRGREK